MEKSKFEIGYEKLAKLIELANEGHDGHKCLLAAVAYRAFLDGPEGKEFFASEGYKKWCAMAGFDAQGLLTAFEDL